MPDIFIELDRDRDFDDTEEPTRQRPSRFGKRWRPWAAAGLVAVVLSTLGSAGLRPGSSIELVAELATHSQIRMVNVDGRLILLEPGLLRAIEISSGKQIWQMDTGLEDGYHYFHEGHLILNGVPPGVDRQRSRTRSISVDPASGAVHWQLPGNVEIFEDLIIAYEMGPLPQDGAANIVIYTRDAKPIWSLPQGEGMAAIQEGRSLISSVNPATGELVERDLRTGVVANRYTFPELKGLQGMHYKNGVAYFFFDDGRTLTFDGIAISDYGSDDLGFGSPAPTDCGLVMCHQKTDGPGYYLTDKATGRKVFESSDWELLVRVGQGVVGLRFPRSEGPMPALAHFDPSTGNVMELQGWSVLDLEFLAVPQPVSREPAYLWSYQKELDYFGVLENGAVRVIGVKPHAGELRTCAAYAPYVACAVGSDLVRIWRLT